MRNEYFALLRWQFAQRQLERFQKHAACVKRIRSSIGRWQQVFELQGLVVFALDSGITEVYGLLFAKQVDDAIAGHAE